MKPDATASRRFTKAQRLLKSGEFSRVMAKARRSADRLFTVLARGSQLEQPRLGLAISRKSARRAVDRNRIKRISREAFRQCGHDAAVDVIVFARNAAASESRAALRSSLDKHFRRLISEQTA